MVFQTYPYIFNCIIDILYHQYYVFEHNENIIAALEKNKSKNKRCDGQTLLQSPQFLAGQFSRK